MTTDDRYVRKALDLARTGVGLVSPNPAVGAVLVDEVGREVGSGTHTYAGVKHAEILALEQAGQSARGGTLYLNLEPCSYWARTGPCADAIVAAGVSRVVCSMQDPNPQVAGRGFQRLRDAGIKVEVGLLEAEARKLNESFAKYITTGKPLVTLKSALSLDAKIAPAAKMRIPASPDFNSEVQVTSGNRWITGKAARNHVQQLRHQSDAILVGVGTVIADDPVLSDRSGLPRRRKLLRVILDSSLRVPIDSRIFREVQHDIVVISSSPDSKKHRALEAKGVRVLETSSVGGRPEFAPIFRTLGEMEITSVLVEGGSTINQSALASGEVDKVFLFYAPKILGAAAVPFLANTSDPWQMRCVDRIEFHRFGEDFAIEGYLRDPYVV